MVHNIFLKNAFYIFTPSLKKGVSALDCGCIIPRFFRGVNTSQSRINTGFLAKVFKILLKLIFERWETAIFENFFKWEQYGEIEITEYNPKNAQQQKWIAKKDEDWIRDIVILKPHVRAGRKKKIVSNLKYIILKDKDIEIKIDLNELEVLQVFPYPYFSERLGYYELMDLLKAFRSLILNKAGYDILEKENYEKRRN